MKTTSTLILSLSLLGVLLAGCASTAVSDTNIDPVMQANITPLIGKTSHDVVVALGIPGRKKSIQLLTGEQYDLYIYSYSDTLARFRGFWTDLKYSLTGVKDRTLTVTMANDKVLGIKLDEPGIEVLEATLAVPPGLTLKDAQDCVREALVARHFTNTEANGKITGIYKDFKLTATFTATEIKLYRTQAGQWSLDEEDDYPKSWLKGVKKDITVLLSQKKSLDK